MIFFDTHHFNYVMVTSTTYGTWLPGDARGFVSKTDHGLHNAFDTPYDADIPLLKAHCERNLKEPPVLFDSEQAHLILICWQQAVAGVGWHLFAVAVMPNHFHAVLASPVGQRKEDYLRTLKARASFLLNKKYGKRTWWTTSGSVRYCFDRHLLDARIENVRKQANSLVVWYNPEEFTLR